jgi:cyclase
VSRPELIDEMAREFGSQCTVLAVDAIGVSENHWEVVVQSGRVRSGHDVVAWCVEAVGRGVGEILLTSWDRDGTRSGYCLELWEALIAGEDAVLAASIFHSGEYSVRQIKDYLQAKQIEVRQ